MANSKKNSSKAKKATTKKQSNAKKPQKNNTSEKKGKEVSKAEKIKPFSELATIASRQEWVKRHFIEFVESTYKGCEIKVEELNPRQIKFTIDGINVPSEGYFTVK